MWRQQLFEDICCPSPFLSLVPCLTLGGDVTLKKVCDDMALLLTSDLCHRDGFSPWTFVWAYLILYLLFSLLRSPYNLIWKSSDGLMSSDWAIGPVSIALTIPPD